MWWNHHPLEVQKNMWIWCLESHLVVHLSLLGNSMVLEVPYSLNNSFILMKKLSCAMLATKAFVADTTGFSFNSMPCTTAPLIYNGRCKNNCMSYLTYSYSPIRCRQDRAPIYIMHLQSQTSTEVATSLFPKLAF